ncbi:DEP domain-containing protein 1B, protein [Aphelenchoides fujianensis]|nr:DEP domain-containing protein 1B, protein [Aphelenchoides fujianensis]
MSSSLTRQKPIVPVRRQHGMETPMRQNNFDATRKWKEMIRRFVSDVPLESNRRMFRTHADSFTGLRAADTLLDVLRVVFPERTTDRSNSVRVLQKFIEDHVIEDVADAKCRQFKDDATLYKIPDAAYAKADMNPPPSRIRRAASLNSSSAGDCGTPQRTRKFSGDSVRLIKHRSFFDGINDSTNRAPLAFQDDDEAESPPKLLKLRYAQSDERENNGRTNAVLWAHELTNLLEEILNSPKFNEKEAPREFKECYPHIWEKRFPNNSYQPPQFSLFDRFKNFIGPS